MNEQEIFQEVLDCDQQCRARLLDDMCGHDSELRQRIEKLVRLHERVGDHFEKPAGEIVGVSVAPSLSELPGDEIGPYKLREKIGEGGMGLVYVAEQTEPVRRKVALKIVKPGMASSNVAARFEAERQALAMMDHPNIARVFDGGATESGQLYFVMELVQGSPLTDYCNEHQLDTRVRLELFQQVCQAVHHAHRKGIIHRDLKPSNVLVPEIDGKAVPKVIDFGIAKALGEKLSDLTIYTHFSQLIGTPVYMSPEQAGLGVVDVDTRSDVYSLGVMLYELLTGNTPFDHESLHQVGYDEMRRIIREEQPRRPSNRISTLSAEALSTVALQCHSDPRTLSDTLRGELDWVVMKALEKDRDRRYESANALAEDIQRYRDNEIVSARPPSTFYRIRKFAHRNRALVTSAFAIFLALATGFAVATLGWLAAQRRLAQVIEEQASNQALVAFHREMFSSAYGQEVQSQQTTLRELTERIAEELDKGRLREFPEVEIEIRRTIGSALQSHGRHDRGRECLQRALELARTEYGEFNEIVLGILCSLANEIHSDIPWPFDRVAIEQYAKQALEVAQQLGDKRRTSDALNWLAHSLRFVPERYQEGEAYQRRSVMIREEMSNGEDSRQLVFALWDLTVYLADGDQRQLDEALHVIQRAIEMSERIRGRNDNMTANLIGTQGRCYRGKGRLAKAIQCYREAQQIYRQLGLGNEKRVLLIGESLAETLHMAHQHAAANRILDDIDRICREQGMDEWQCNFTLVRGWGHLLQADYAAAERILRQAVELGDKHSTLVAVDARLNLSRCLDAQGLSTEASLVYDQFIDLIEPHVEMDAWGDELRFHYAWALLHGSDDRAEEALRWAEEGLTKTRAWPHQGREPDLLLAKAVALHRLGKHQEAIEKLTDAIGRIEYPACQPMLYDTPRSRSLLEKTLADFHEQQGNLDAAKQVFRDGIEERIKRFGNADHLQVALAELTYGKFLLKHGETDLAKEYLSSAARKLNGNPEAAQASRDEAARQLSVIEAVTIEAATIEAATNGAVRLNAENVQQDSPQGKHSGIAA